MKFKSPEKSKKLIKNNFKLPCLSLKKSSKCILNIKESSLSRIEVVIRAKNMPVRGGYASRVIMNRLRSKSNASTRAMKESGSSRRGYLAKQDSWKKNFCYIISQFNERSKFELGHSIDIGVFQYLI